MTQYNPRNLVNRLYQNIINGPHDPSRREFLLYTLALLASACTPRIASPTPTRERPTPSPSPSPTYTPTPTNTPKATSSPTMITESGINLLINGDLSDTKGFRDKYHPIRYWVTGIGPEREGINWGYEFREGYGEFWLHNTLMGPWQEVGQPLIGGIMTNEYDGIYNSDQWLIKDKNFIFEADFNIVENIIGENTPYDAWSRAALVFLLHNRLSNGTEGDVIIGSKRWKRIHLEADVFRYPSSNFPFNGYFFPEGDTQEYPTEYAYDHKFGEWRTITMNLYEMLFYGYGRLGGYGEQILEKNPNLSIAGVYLAIENFKNIKTVARVDNFKLFIT